MSKVLRLLSDRLLLAFVGGFFCALISWFSLLEPLDRMLYDLANKGNPLPTADDILLIAIDDRSLLELGRWPWPRERHVELLRYLNKVDVAAIAIDIVFSEADVEYPQVDELLAEEIKKLGNIVLPVFIAQAYPGGQLLEIEPMEKIKSVAAKLGHVHIQIDEDGLTRSVFLKEGLGTPQWQHFSVALSNVLGQKFDKLPGLRVVSNQKVYSALSIARSHKNLISFVGPAGAVNTVSYADVVKGRIPARELRNKVIFIGSTAAGQGDNIITSVGRISGVELNANIFHGLRTGRLAQPVAREIQAFFGWLVAMFSILLLARLESKSFLVVLLLSTGAMPLCALWLLREWQLWISPAPAMLMTAIAFPFLYWLRLEDALNFVRKQLKILEGENYFPAPLTADQNIRRRAVFLETLGLLKSWKLENASAQELPCGWQHTSTSSSKLFSLNNRPKQLMLEWESKRDISTKALDLLFPDTCKSAERVEYRGERFQADLVQMDKAYRQTQYHRQLVASTMGQLNAGLILSDGAGDIILINQQAKNLLMLPPETKNIFQVLNSYNEGKKLKIQYFLSLLLFEGTQFYMEGRASGSNNDLLCRGSLIMLDQAMMLFTITDVSSLKRSERNRAEALDFLSHDLRAPLASVLALIEGARMEHPSGLNLELLEAIEGYVQKNLSYADNFIQLSRLEHTNNTPFDECDAQSLMDDAVAQLFHVAKKKNITLNLSTCEQAIRINCNRDFIERALINLIDNAIKYSQPNSKIYISLSCDETQVIFVVKDEGVGISKQDQDRIFDIFQQATQARKGVGLGLHFVSSVANLHNGTIKVCANEGKGSIFTFCIPYLHDVCLQGKLPQSHNIL